MLVLVVVLVLDLVVVLVLVVVIYFKYIRTILQFKSTLQMVHLLQDILK